MTMFGKYQKEEVDTEAFHQAVLVWEGLPLPRPPLHKYLGMPYPAFHAWRKGDATLEEFRHPNPRVDHIRFCYGD